MKEIQEPADIDALPADTTLLYSARQLRLCLEKIGNQEIEKNLKKLSCSEKELMEGFTAEVVKRILHTTTKTLKVNREKSGANAKLEALRGLFDPASLLIGRKAPNKKDM